MDNLYLQHLKFDEINVHDPFFKSLKEDYEEFEKWYSKKSDEQAYAYVHYDNANSIQGFLYIKMEENNAVYDVNPPIEAEGIVKVGTFKINAHRTKMGEQFLKVAFDYAVEKNAEVCYITIFEKHKGLIDLICRFGFEYWGTKKTGEKVYLKNLQSLKGDVFRDYPFVKYQESRKFILSIYPKYHSRLFPESILTNENRNIIKDISYANSIQKNYVCSMQGVEELHEGDLIVMYRTAEDGKIAEYSAVATTVCTVTDIRLQESFKNFDEFFAFTSRFTLFEKEDLAHWFRKGGLKVISMLYNFSLKKRIVRHELIENIGLERNRYWGFFELDDNEFVSIVKRGEAIEYLR